jgi:hypothetical protein
VEEAEAKAVADHPQEAGVWCELRKLLLMAMMMATVGQENGGGGPEQTKNWNRVRSFGD